MDRNDLKTKDTGPSDWQEKWLNPRRKRFWVLIAILLYTLCGFFLVPAVAGKLVVSNLEKKLGRQVTLEKVRFNPYTLVLRADGFRLSDTDGVLLCGFEELLVNLQVSSLFHWAWTFDEFRLDGAYLHFERFAPGDTRLSRLLNDAASGKTGDSESDTGESFPRLRIHSLTLNEGRMDFRDQVPGTPVDMEIGPINISVEKLNTLPDQYGQQSVYIELPGDTHLTWQGNISFSPLDSEGDLTLENSHLEQTVAYLKALLPLESASATMTVKTHYRVGLRGGGVIGVELDDLEASVTDLQLTGLNPVTDFFALAALKLDGGTLRYPENEIRFTKLHLSQPALTAWLDQQGTFSLLILAPPERKTRSAAAQASPPASPWKVSIDELALENGRVEFSDYRISPPASVSVAGIEVTASGVSNQPGQRMPLELSGNLDAGGEFSVGGDVVAFPDFGFNGQVRSNEIPLSLAQPYVQQSLKLVVENGALTARADLAIAPEKITASGSAGIQALHIKETVENENLVGWQQLDVDRFELDAAAQTLHLSRMDFSQPFGRIKINTDRTTNLSGLSVREQTSNPEPDAESEQPWSYVIGGIRVNDASLDFSDLSLPLPFATSISSLDGTLSTVDSSSSEPAAIQLEGQVNEYGLARVEGSMNMFDPIGHTDVNVEFRNLLMSNLSPYSAEFAGREIDEGRLNLDLQYIIQQGKLQGSNKMVLNELTLGDEVESPDATSLPLDLAVALLTDADGVIDIELPVVGDINDPEFRIGGVIWKAFTVLITKVVSAPFRLLGSLIGIDSDDLGQFQFLAGRADLTAPELEKVGQLQQALQQRPELEVEIKGPYDPAADTPKLQFFSLRSRVIALLGEAAHSPADETAMLDDDIRSALETLFIQRFPEKPLPAIQATYTQPPADDPEGKPELDQLAYTAELRDQLLESEAVSREDLENLAQARAEAIHSAFLASGNFDAGRIVIGDPVEVTSDDGEWVITELGVLTD